MRKKAKSWAKNALILEKSWKKAKKCAKKCAKMRKNALFAKNRKNAQKMRKNAQNSQKMRKNAKKMRVCPKKAFLTQKLQIFMIFGQKCLKNDQK